MTAADTRRDSVTSLQRTWHDGRIKHYVQWRLLTLRRADPELFLSGNYIPLEVSGTLANNILAFARTHDRQALIVVLPRLVANLCPPDGGFPTGEAWSATTIALNTALPKSGKTARWRNRLTDQTISPTDGILTASELFTDLPFAVLAFTRTGG